MIGLILRIKGIEKVDCSFDFYVERDRALHFEKGDLLFAYDNGPEYYACIDTDIVGRGALKCRAVILDGVREVVVSGYTGFTIPCMGEGTTISCRGYSIEFSEAENLPQGGDVPDVDWPDGSNLNDYTTDGVYSIKGKRVNGDNMPILNEGVIAARLTVLSTDDGAGNTVVTQVLSLNNNAGGEGNVYVRSSQEGHWKPWGKLQTNIEVGQVNTLDNLTDNGMYSGVLMADTGFDTFVLVVINNYAAAVPAGYGWYVSQLKYSLGLDGTVTVKTRRMDYTNTWTEWENLRGSAGTSNIEAEAPLAQKDGKLSLNIGDGLKVEDNKLVAIPQSGGDTSNALRALFVAAGAEYNDTGVDIVRATPWFDYVDDVVYKGYYGIDVLNYTSADIKAITQDGTTYQYVIDNGVYKVIGRDNYGKIVHNDGLCIHRAGHYYLNGLGDITEGQMMEIYNHGNTLAIKYFLNTYKRRTNRMLTSIATTTELDGYYYARDCESEVVTLDKGEYSIVNTKNPDNVFGNMFKLTHLLGRFRFESAVSNGFYNCKLLKTVKIFQLKYNLSLSDCPLISKASLLYAINNSAATSAITITLHANAYARFKDNPEIVSALANKPLVTLVSA